MSPVRQDYLLKMIEGAFEVLRRIRKRRQDGDAAGAIRDADAAADDLLGPMAAIAARMDPFTAAQLLRDPERVTLWARILAEKAGALRDSGHDARPTGRRALELAIEAWLLEDDQRRLTATLREVLAEALAMTRDWAAPEELAARHRAALADALRYLPPVPAAE
jgi:hypothetical protein